MKEITQYKTNRKYFLDENGYLHNSQGKMECTTILTTDGPKTYTRDKWFCVVYKNAPTDKKFYTYRDYLGNISWVLKQSWKPNTYVPEIDDFRRTYIYYLCDIKDGIPRYVGKTDNPKKRISSHKRESIHNRRGKSSHKQNWISNVYQNGSKIEMVIIDEVVGDGSFGSGDWTWVEEYWGNQMSQWGFPIIFDGGWGTGGNRRKRTEQEKEHNRKVQTHLLGVKSYLYDIYEKTYQVFDSNKSCSRYLNDIGVSGIIKTLHSDTTIAGKYLFSYNQYTWEEIYDLLKNKTNWDRKVLQFDMDFENIIDEFESLRDAIRKKNCTNISACLDDNKTNRKSAGGYRWVYKLDYVYLGLDGLKKKFDYKTKSFVYTKELIDDCLSMKYIDVKNKYKGIVSHGTIGNIRNNPEYFINKIGKKSNINIKKEIF